MAFLTLGEIINQALADLDRPASWLAQRLGVSSATVSRWCSGETRPSYATVIRIADVLGLHGQDRHALLTAAGYPPPAALPATPPPEPMAPTISEGTGALPPKSYRRLIGRLEPLDALLDVLRNPNHQRLVAIIGLGGIGKTALAREVVGHCEEEKLFEQIIWSSAKLEHLVGEQRVQMGLLPYTFETLLDDVARACGRVDITLLPLPAKERAIEQIFASRHLLVVLDNLETAVQAETLVHRLHQRLGQSRVLITSRHQVRYESVYTVTLGGLRDDEGILFLREESRARNIEAVREAEGQTLLRIHRVTGGAPLAMRLVAGQMQRQRADEVMAALDAAAFQGQDYPFYHFVYRHSWELLDRVGRMVLVDLSVFPPLSGGSWGDVQAVSQVESALFGGGVEQLVAMSLADKIGIATQERVALHPLTQYFIRSDITGEWERL